MTSGPLTPVFHPEAEAEFNAAIDWYEARAQGLGREFAAEVRAAIGRATALPLAWQVVDGEIRLRWSIAIPMACSTHRSRKHSSSSR